MTDIDTLDKGSCGGFGSSGTTQTYGAGGLELIERGSHRCGVVLVFGLLLKESCGYQVASKLLLGQLMGLEGQNVERPWIQRERKDATVCNAQVTSQSATHVLNYLKLELLDSIRFIQSPSVTITSRGFLVVVKHID